MSPETAITRAYRCGWARVLAAVVRLTRDLDVAEDAVQAAFASAVETWRRDGVPVNPVAWLTTVSRRKALDLLRHEQRFARKLPLLIVPGEDDRALAPSESFHDDRLRLIFTCCHPALSNLARVALTLRLVCALGTPEIARLFLVSESTMAARITRAKKKIRTAGIPYRAPADDERAERLPAVLAVVYLMFTEGHTASRGTELTQPRLTEQAVDVARALVELMPQEPEALGLLALLRLSEARRTARLDEHCRPVALEHQDRFRRDSEAIAEGIALVKRALLLSRTRGPGPYVLQAAIAAVHAEAPSYDATDWRQILSLYDALLAVHPSPVAAISRAVALAEVSGAHAALAEIDRLAGDARLGGYHLLGAARAELLQRIGRYEEAAAAYAEASTRTDNAIEQDLLRRRRADTLLTLARSLDMPVN